MYLWVNNEINIQIMGGANVLKLSKFDVHQIIVSACVGCKKIKGDICIAYPDPAGRHRLYACPLKTHKKNQTTSNVRK